MSEMWCPPPCRDKTRIEINLNHTLCSDCGVVHQTSSDWFTTFPNPVGVGIGDPSNPLPNGCLCSSSGDSSLTLSHWPIRPHHQLITTMCDKLGLVATIKDRANEIYKKVEDLKSSRVRNQEAVLAACLYIACRQEDRPRTVKEICSVAGTTIKEVGRAKKFIVKQLQAEMGLAMEMGTITAGIFLSRFCSLLGMSNAATKASQETAQKSGELDIRRSPISIAAAVIYMITQLSDEKKTIRDIMLATGVAELTIRNSYKDLYPHASMLIPTSFATEEDLGRLSAP